VPGTDTPAPGTTPGAGTTAVAGPIFGSIQTSLKFTNDTTGNSKVFKVGDHYTVTVTGPSKSYVYVIVDNYNGGKPQKWQILDGATSVTITGTFTSSDAASNVGMLVPWRLRMMVPLLLVQKSET
jgi:hypothetical protein